MAFLLTLMLMLSVSYGASSDAAKIARSRSIFSHQETPTLGKQQQQQSDVNFGFWHKRSDDDDDGWFDEHPDDWIPPVVKRIVRHHDNDDNKKKGHYDVVKRGYKYHYHSHHHTSSRHSSINSNNNNNKKSNKKKYKKFHATRKNVEQTCRDIFEQVFPPQGFTSVQRLESIPFVTSDDDPDYYDDVYARLGPNCFDSLSDFSHQDFDDFLESMGLNVSSSSSSSSSPLHFSETINGEIYVAGTTCSFTKTFVQMYGSPTSTAACHVEMDSFLVMQLDPLTGYLVKWMDFFDTREFEEKFTSCRDDTIPTTSLEDDDETDDEVDVDDDSMQVDDDAKNSSSTTTDDDTDTSVQDPATNTDTDNNSENGSVVEGPAIATSAEEQNNGTTTAISMTAASSMLLLAGGVGGGDALHRSLQQEDTDSTNGTAADIAAQCRLIFETLFPPRQWTTLQDVQNFANLVAPQQQQQQQQQDDTGTQDDEDADEDDEPPYNYFAFPQGADYMTDGTWMENFNPQSDLVDWFATYWSPDVLEFGEYIVGNNIKVVDSQPCGAMGPMVCSMDKVLVAKFKYNDQCYVKINSHLIMELINNNDDNGGGGGYKMLRWVDYFDAQELLEKLSNCVDVWDTVAAATAHSLNSGKKEFQILGMSITSPMTLHSDAVVPDNSNSNNSRMSFVHFLGMVPLAMLAATAVYVSKKERAFLDDNNKSSLKLINTDDSLPKHHHYGATSTEHEAAP